MNSLSFLSNFILTFLFLLTYSSSYGQCGENGYYLDQNDTTVCLGDSLDLSVLLSSTFLNIPGNGVTDIDGNTYSSVLIGNQEWMGENLKTTKYANGSSIPNITSNSSWQTLTSGAWCYWGNSSANNADYGKLYNWYVVSDSQNVCPANWHVPSQAEASTMINYLGGIGVAGGKIKEIGTTHWKTPNMGATNTSGFTALPGGYRDDFDGGFYVIGNGGSGIGLTNSNSIGRHWTSTPADSSNDVSWPDKAYEFGVHQAQSAMNIASYGFDRNWGISIRCLKDSIPTSYNWSTGDTLASITVVPSQTTTYYVTITSAAGTCMDSVTVYIQPKILNAGLDQSTCFGSSVTLSATGGTSYSWNNSVTNGLPFSPLTTLEYVVSGVDTAGCADSDTLTVIVNSVSTGMDVQTACDTYDWIDGNTYTASNSTATHTLMNAIGCDSIVTLNLTINASSSSTDVQTACNSYAWIDGNTYTSSNNTATYTLTNAVGCDSIVTLDLTINASSSSTDVQTACNSYAWIDGNTYTASNNTATHTLMNAMGCDSIVTLNLTINASSSSTDVQTACVAYDWIDGNTYTTSNNAAQWTLTNAAGCDSVVTLDLTIIPLPDNSVTQMGTMLSAYQIGAMYQWLDCDNGNGVIAAEINQNYTPNVTGNYAVEVTLNGCTDTSACYLVDYTGLSDLYNEILSIHPNPAKDVLFIDGINELNAFNYIEIVSLTGEIIEKFETAKKEINVSNYPSGVYFLKVSHDKGIELMRFVKQ